MSVRSMTEMDEFLCELEEENEKGQDEPHRMAPIPNARRPRPARSPSPSSLCPYVTGPMEWSD
jgi:hypothetical protein